MNPEAELFRYAWPTPGSFWHWSDNAEAVNWHDGSTLVLYEEIEIALRRLQTKGWPRLEQLLLVLAASRSNWLAEGVSRLRSYFEAMDAMGWSSGAPPDLRNLVEDSLEKVHRIASRAQFESGLTAAITELVFATSTSVVGPFTADAILQLFRNGSAAAAFRQHNSVAQIPPNPEDLARSLGLTFRSILKDCKSLDSDADLDLFDETGLPEIPVPAEIAELPLVQRIRTLVDLLVENENHELAGIARVARNLSAVVSLPRPVSETRDLPIGGYSDVANRGQFDRLLVSELAQDPDVLAVRVAMNEALYLRRESPPHRPARKRAIFIDTGIRMWGLPRVFAFSLALALAIRSDRDCEIEVFTESGQARLDSLDGLTRLLSELSPAPRPGFEFGKFLARFSNEEAERILITTPAVAADRDFQNWIAENRETDFFIATVDRNGRYELAIRGENGQRRLQCARLDLEHLLSDPTDSKNQQLLRDRAAWLPAILRQKSFPLRLAASVAVENTVFHPEVGLVGHSKDGMILHWPDLDYGAKMISDSIPRGLVKWCEIDPETSTAWFLIPRAGGSAVLVTADLKAEDVTTIRLNHGIEFVRHAFRSGDFLVLAGDTRLVGHSLETGERLHEQSTARASDWSGRFVQIDRQWRAISLGGGGFRLEQLPGHHAWFGFVWEHPDYPAPLALANDLAVFCLTDPPQKLSEPAGSTFVRLERISADRNRLLALARPAGEQAPRREFIDFQKGIVSHQISSTFHRLEPEAMRVFQNTPEIRKRFKSVAIGKGGSLQIVSRRNESLTLNLISSSLSRIEWKPSRSEAPERALRPFESVDPPAGSRVGLKKAAWPDGSSAWLDQRGLLHLKSANQSIPEVTLTLKDGPVSAWASTGEMAGINYFIDRNHEVGVEVIFGYVRDFAAHVRLHRANSKPVIDRV